MSVPLNIHNTKPCDPVSSNCVIWQGPDISCINLCKGDSVSMVVYKLATELCEVLNTLDISNYDLSCFDLTSCGPQNFQELIQFLIDKQCETQGLTPGDVKSDSSGCPDCLVNVASCFVQGNVTTMQLIDYVNAIANKLCDLVTQITIINNTLNSQDIRITNLENTPPPTFTLPDVKFDCIINGNPGGFYRLDNAVQIILDYLCSFNLGDIATAITYQCAGINTSPSFVNPSNDMQTQYFGSWVTSPSTLADSIKNLWLTVCDLRSGLENPTVEVTSKDCSIEVTDTSSGSNYSFDISVQDTGWVNLQGFDYYPINYDKPQVRRLGKMLCFRGNVMLPLANDSTGALIPLTLSSGVFSYTTSYHAKTYEGSTPAGVTVNSEGGVYLNKNTSVLPVGFNLCGTIDGTYSIGVIGERQIYVSGQDNRLSLSSYFKVFIRPDGTLYVTTVRDTEAAADSSPGTVGGSALRYITSVIRTGEYVPKHNTSTAQLHSFKASNTVETVNTDTSTNAFTYPLTLDAGEPAQIGGFFFKLDGLIAYIN